MSKMTYQAYLNYIGQASRMMGWGALLIYDRHKTNTLLAQEYIERFTSGNDFPTINVTSETDQGSWTDMRNFMFDKPRLSFTNSSIASSRARLSMRVVSGEYLSLNKGLGEQQASIVSVAKLDPLNAPYLYMDIRLEEMNPGVVDGEGKVLLDLSRGESYTFKLSSSEDRNLKLGQAVEKLFKSWTPAQQRFELNRFVAGEGLLKPSSFAVRTHSLAHAGSVAPAQEDDAEEGAVLVGVAFNGQSNGTFPIKDSDLPYLLPDPPNANDDAFSMNILLSNGLWVPELIGKMLAQSPEFTAVQPEYVKDIRGFITRVDIGRGSAVLGGLRKDFNPPKVIIDADPIFVQVFSIDYPEQTFHFGSDLLGKLEILLSQDRLTVKWSGGGARTLGVTANTGSGDPYRSEHGFNADWVFSNEYAFGIVPSGEYKGQVKLEETQSVRNLKIQPHSSGNWANPFVGEIHANLNEALQKKFDAVLAILLNSGVSIDALRLNNLLFRSHQVAQPREVVAPGEFSLLGTLAPERTAFAIEPLEPVVSAGASLQLSIQPAATGVQWSVENLPGESGAKGIISGTGLYRAPSSDTFIGDASRRVLVVARKGDAVSRALVSITANDISVYPWLQVAQHGGQRYVLVAAEGSGSGQLNWTLAPGSLGRVRDPGPQDDDLDIPQGQSVKVYESPAYAPGPPGSYQEAVHFDQIVVQAGSGSSETVDLLVPWSTPTSWFTVQRVAGDIELTMWTQGRNGPEKIEPEYAFWYLVTGGGELRQNLYTPEENGRGYAIIVAIEDYRRLNYAYIVLPVPFVSTRHFNLLRQQSEPRNTGGLDHE